MGRSAMGRVPIGDREAVVVSGGLSIPVAMHQYTRLRS